jgi:hypothetical protein
MSKALVTTALVLLMLALTPGAAGRQPDGPPLYRLWLPDKSWALDLDLSAFDLPRGAARAPLAKSGKEPKAPNVSPVESLNEDGSVYLLYAFGRTEEQSPSSSVMLMVSMRPAQSAGGAEAFREHRLKNLGGGGYHLIGGKKTWEYKQIPLARFTSEFAPYYNTPMQLGGRRCARWKPTSSRTTSGSRLR